MPFQNRVAPTGELIAVPDRGTFTGNRGVLHDEDGRIVRQLQVRRWITCRLSFRGWYRPVMLPRRYTHLFFLDEATALAAGHRPCAACRHADYQRFRQCWGIVHGTPSPTAAVMDDVLHDQRWLGAGPPRTHPEEAAGVPDGVLVLASDVAWLVNGGALHRWTPGGYTERRGLPVGRLETITPAASVEVIRAGYRPDPRAGAAPR
jgi:hypothetical protein